MKKLLEDFKKFISKGNIFDLAIAVVIGNAFNAITNSLVNSVIMPIISLLTGGVSVKDWKIVITKADAVSGIEENAICYGEFIQSIINFFIIALSIFFAVKFVKSCKENLTFVNKKLKKGILNKQERQEMQDLGLNPKTLKDIEKYVKIQEEKEKQQFEESEKLKKQKEEQEKLENPTEQELLKQIRDILKNK